MKKNVLFIDVDALMPSRINLLNEQKLNLPGIEALQNNSTNCINTFSMGNPTEFALPGLFSSSYLLDNGGYRYGISNSKVTMAEKMQENGYQTVSLFSIFRPEQDGYSRGFDDFYHLYDICVTEKNLYNTINWYRKKLLDKELDKQFCRNQISEYYEQYLEDIIRFGQRWQSYKNDNVIPDSKIFYNFDYEMLINEVKEHQKEINNNHYYIDDFLKTGKIFLSKIIEKISKNKKRHRKNVFQYKFSKLLLKNIFFIIRKCNSYNSFKEVFALTIDRIINGPNKMLMRYPSGLYLYKTFKNWLYKKRDINKPFYAYIKLLDSHELNFYTQDLESSYDEELIQIKEFLKNIRSQKNYNGNVLYDCSIKYIDIVLNKFINLLKSQNLFENTIIVITADHGAQFPDYPSRENNHRLGKFFDELYHVPFIFSTSHSNKVVKKELYSSVDINSSILDYLNIGIPETFRGHSIFDQASGREYILAENQGRGPCDLKNKSISVCVRSKEYKLIYEQPPSANKQACIRELYHIKKDTLEQKNLCKSDIHLKEAQWLVSIAKERVKEILK
tara:strand:+ start:4141 stop:5820 length:1680 start_codon:yes stop_codon:yes gene_type:complete